MSEFPQATSRRELRERERAAESSRSRPEPRRRDRAGRAKAVDTARPVGSRTAAARPVASRTAAARPVARQGSRARTVGSRLLSVAAMLFAAVIVVGMSVPANAFFPASPDSTSTLSASSSKLGQSVAVSSDEKVDVGARDKIGVLSWAQVLAQKYSRVGATIGGTGSGPVRWPFPYPVRVSSPFGPRVAPCSGCSTYHRGIDVVPGDKAAIFAAASGVVTTRDDGTTSYGNYVIITSQVNGRTVTFTYAHMTSGSSPLELGQKVAVGDFVGLVGNTGESTGPHLHFEVNVDGTTIDPIPWMEANAGPGGTN